MPSTCASWTLLALHACVANEIETWTFLALREHATVTIPFHLGGP